MAGFTFAYCLNGGNQRTKEYTIKDTTVLTKGEMCEFDTGEIDTASSGGTAFIGAAEESVDNTSDGETVKVTINADAVYRVADTTARLPGVELDLASGGLALTTDSNSDFVVVDSDSTYTWVIINSGAHFTTGT